MKLPPWDFDDETGALLAIGTAGLAMILIAIFL